MRSEASGRMLIRFQCLTYSSTVNVHREFPASQNLKMLAKPNTVHPAVIEEESLSISLSEETKPCEPDPEPEPSEPEAVVQDVQEIPQVLEVQTWSTPVELAEVEKVEETIVSQPGPAHDRMESVQDLSDEDNNAEIEPGVRRSPEGKEGDNKDGVGPGSKEDINAYIDKVIGPLDIPLPMSLPGQVDPDEEGFRSRAGSTTSRGSYKAPPNIDALYNVGHLLIKQINKDKEDFANVPNNYEIDAKGIGRIFIGKEETHPEVRAKVQTSTTISQPFRMSIFDVSTGLEVIRVDRNGVNEAPTMVMQKKSKNMDEQLGVILFESGWLMMTPTYTVNDHTGKTVLRITGPPSGRLCHSINYVTSTFDIFTPDGQHRLAKITKDGDFYVNVKDKAEPITKEENFYIDFEEPTMDVKIKALILGAMFMLDYTYYKEPSFLTKLASFFCIIAPCCCRGHK